MKGRCTCGAVTYRLTSAPLYTHCCHCRWCQRETGTAFALNTMIEADRLELLNGGPQATTIPTQSGKGQTVFRCPTCRVALWSHYAGAGEKICFVRVGTLEDPEAVPPDVHIFTESRQPWVILPENVPLRPRFYRRDEFWPAESLARWKALHN